MDEINIGQLGQIPLGQGRCFRVKDQDIAVFRPRSGGLYAIANQCPHRLGPLAEGVCDAEGVICPYHGHFFRFDTGLGREAGEKVCTYPVREVDGELFLTLVNDGTTPCL